METEGFSVLTFVMLGVTVVWVVLAFGVGKLAQKQGRNFAGWFILSLILSPILVTLLLLLLGKSTAAAIEQAARQQTIKIRCTECGATVDEGSRFCPSCGSEMPDIPNRSETEQQVTERSQQSEGGHLSTAGILLTVVLMILFALVGAYTALRTGQLHRGIGLIGGIGVGLVFAYGVRKTFPEQMTTQ